MKIFRYVWMACLCMGIAFSITCAQDTPSGTDSSTEVETETVKTAAGSDFDIQKTKGIDSRFEPVIKRLVEEKGWDEMWVRGFFRDDRTVFIPKMVVVKPRKKVNSSGWYTWVNTNESSRACILFIDQYDSILEAAEKKYGVDKETIAALLRCETRHGSVTGDYHVFSVYASMSLMPEDEYIAENLTNAEEQMKGEGKSRRKINDEKDYIANRSRKRGNWAFKELDNLLKIEKAGHFDILAIHGSWAGAFGWSQFLPSSYNRSAVDGDGDGKIDLHDPDDAIHSVANYLKKAGYRSGSKSRIIKALKGYNPSTPYANSIYGLSERVKKDSK